MKIEKKTSKLRKIWKSQKLLLGLTMGTIVSIVIILKYSTYPLIVPFMRFLIRSEQADSFPRDIAISYVAAYIFYIMQVQFFQTRKEKKAETILYNRIKELLINAGIWMVMTEEKKLTELIDIQEPLMVTIKITECIRKESFPLAVGVESPAKTDRIYNFLEKVAYLESQLQENRNFDNLNPYLIERIMELDMDYWFKTYVSLTTVQTLYTGVNIQLEEEKEYKQRIERTSTAIKEIAGWLGIESMEITLQNMNAG